MNGRKYHEVRKLRRFGYSAEAVGRQYGLTVQQVADVMAGRKRRRKPPMERPAGMKPDVFRELLEANGLWT